MIWPFVGHTGAPGIFSDLLKSIQMLKREWGGEGNGKLPHLFNLSKTATLVPEFAVNDLPWAELQPWFLRLQWKTCPWTEHLLLEVSDENSNYLVCWQKIFLYGRGLNLLSSRANLHLSYNPAGRSHCTLQNHHGYIKHDHREMGGSPGDVGEVSMTLVKERKGCRTSFEVGKAAKGWRMSRDVSEVSMT